MPIVYGPGPEPPEPLRPVRDLRGTEVEDVDGRYAGELYGALTDPESGLIRYLDLALDRDRRHVLVPIGHTRFDSHLGRAEVHLRAASRDELSEIPPYEPDAQEPDGPYQQAVLAAHGRLFYGERYYAHPAYDHSGLYAGEHPIIRGPTPPTAMLPLAPLAELPGYRVMDDEPDIRGWPLFTGDGTRAGSIDDLIVDTDAEKVRYAVVSYAENGATRRVLLPVGFLQVADADELVRALALVPDRKSVV